MTYSQERLLVTIGIVLVAIGAIGMFVTTSFLMHHPIMGIGAHL